MFSHEPEAPVPTSWEDLRSLHLFAAHARQMRLLAQFNTGKRWDIDLQTGQYVIGENVGTLNVLGNFSNNSNTWMHGWRVVEINNFDNSLSTRSNLVRKQGELLNVSVLSDAVVHYEDADPVELAAVCASLAGEVPYYSGPTDGGDFVFSLEDARLGPPLPQQEVINVIITILNRGVSNPKIGLQKLLEQEKYVVEAQSSSIVGTRESEVIEIAFDELGRIKNISGSR